MNEGHRVTTLPNGLRVASDPLPGVETAAIGVWTSCGARNETAAVNGAAHMLEHMLFKGTHRRTAQGLAEEMETVGAHMNAYTGRENTAYYVRSLKPDVALALDVLADILQHSRFDEAEMGRERQVILQEIGQAADTPDDVIFDHFHAAAFPGQPVGRPVLGTSETVSEMTEAALRGYIHSHYAPSRLVLAAAGAVDHDWLVGEAERLFTALPDQPLPPLEAAEYKGGEVREESDLEQVHLLLGFDGIGLHDPDHYAAQVFSTALGGGMSSRLFQEVREKRGLVYTIQSFVTDFADGGLFGVYAGTGGERLHELVPVLCGEMLKAASGFSEAEISRAKAQLRSSLLMGLESTFGRAEMLALNLLTYDRVITVPEVLKRIEEVDGAALVRVARRLLSSAPTIAALGPVGNLESYDRIATRCAA